MSFDLDLITDIIIPLFVGFFGVFAGFWYTALLSRKQEKAIIVFLLREFTLLIKRITMYYIQYLKPTREVSYSTLYEISDSSTFNKLIELTTSKEVIETSLRLKADFFQVIRYADQVSYSLNQNDRNGALRAQEKALIFFLGDVYSNGQFSRNRYKSYIDNIGLLLNYLDKINLPNWLDRILYIFSKSLRKEFESTTNFVNNTRKDMESQLSELNNLREIEKLRIEKSELETIIDKI